MLLKTKILLASSATLLSITGKTTLANIFAGKPSSTFSSLNPKSCNGYPDYCHLPVDYFAWVGTHNSGAYDLRDLDDLHTSFVRSEEFACGYINHDQNITTMLEDGARFLDADLCLWKDGEPYLCHATHGGTSVGLVDGYGIFFADFLREIFNFFSKNEHQAVVVHLSDNLSNNPAYRVNLEQVEKIIDDVCKEYLDQPENYKYTTCPYVYTQEDATAPWPTIEELVKGKKGQPLDVKNRLIFTNSGDFPALGYKTKYISQMFWQSSYFPNQELKDIKSHLHQMCKAPGGIGYEAILGFRFPHCVKELTPKIYDPDFLHDSIYSPDGCNLQQSPLRTRINMLVVDFYRIHWDHLMDFQKTLLAMNSAKLAGIWKAENPPPSTTEKLSTSPGPTPAKQAIPSRTWVKEEL